MRPTAITVIVDVGAGTIVRPLDAGTAACVMRRGSRVVRQTAIAAIVDVGAGTIVRPLDAGVAMPRIGNNSPIAHPFDVSSCAELAA